MTIPPAVDVGNQAGYPDAGTCWGDRCYRSPSPGTELDRLGLCPICRAEILPVTPPDA